MSIPVVMQIRERFREVRRELEQMSKWKEMIVGHGYELAYLQEINNDIDVRQELWKYFEVSSHAIKDWKSQLFRKVVSQVSVSQTVRYLPHPYCCALCHKCGG